MCKKVFLPALFLFFYIAASAQNYVTLYEDCNYSGKKSFLEAGNYSLYQMKMENDMLSCLQIPSGMKVTIYENDNFKGRSKTYYANTACLSTDWNDMASSIVVENQYNQPVYGQNDYVIFYGDCYSKGYSQSLRPGNYYGSQLADLKYNISSFTIYGNLRVRAYINNENLSGYSVTHETSDNCLGNSENDKIGSLVIEYKSTQPNNNYGNNNNNYGNNNNNYGNNNNNYGSSNYATIYANCNYGGNSLRLAPGYYQGDKLGVLKYDISAIEVPSGLRAKVYINNEYLTGTYYTVNENISCMNSNINNRIGSLVIEEVYGNGNTQYQQYGNERVVIYSDANYKGQAASLPPGTYSTMALAGSFPDNALSSLTLPPGYRVVIYEFENFAGKSSTITASKSGFILSSWNDKTSSIAVYKDY